MADLTPSERLQPCLLDRLTDEHPESQKESRDQRIISMRRYRRAVLRDLEWLLNTGAKSTTEDLEEFGEVATSVLNYGIPDLCGSTASGLRPEELEKQLLEAVRSFEPRILPNTVSIHVVSGFGRMDHNTISFEIAGHLWAQPTPDPLYLRTEVDLETGQCVVKDRPDG